MSERDYKKLLLILTAFLLVLILPLALRTKSEAIDLSADQLVIVSPHNESIRFEIEQAFREYYLRTTGRRVSIDWRAVGGASEIARYLASAYTANFRHHWVHGRQQPWNEETAVAFLSDRTEADTPQAPARQAFLDSNIGIGIDLLFGGGQYDFDKQARSGILVPAGVRQRHPEWFAGPQPTLTEKMGGEVWYDQNDRYYGVCFSSFGICYNFDRLAQLGFANSGDTPPIQAWETLGDPRFYNAIGLADPSKSGSINKCFEMLIQKNMQDTIRNRQLARADHEVTTADLDAAWAAAINLIKRLGGNASYITFGAGKVPVDAGIGQIAAGICIDFYGRSQAEWVNAHAGRQIMGFATPTAASAVSTDPVGLLRGAPHRQTAELFIDFLLSREGQKLWGYRAGTPGGPRKYTLHRLPVRRDLYTAADRAAMSAPEADPFSLAGSFTYQPTWTAPLFDLMRLLIRVMIIDCGDELRTSWKTIIDNGGPEQQPLAMQAFERLPFDHHQARDIARAMRNAESQTSQTREWILFFQQAFREARQRAAANPSSPQ